MRSISIPASPPQISLKSRLLVLLALLCSALATAVAQPGEQDAPPCDTIPECVNVVWDTVPGPMHPHLDTVPVFGTHFNGRAVVSYRYRKCNGGITEYDILGIIYGDPILFSEYLLAVGSGHREEWLRDLFNKVFLSLALRDFDSNYRTDSINYARYPTVPGFLEAYQGYLCPNGQRTARMVHAQCMTAITRGDSVRYASCFGQEFCCVKTVTMCRDIATGTTNQTTTSNPMPPFSACDQYDPLWMNSLRLYEDEEIAPCMPYCDIGEIIWSGTMSKDQGRTVAVLQHGSVIEPEQAGSTHGR